VTGTGVTDKRITLEEAVSSIESGMTIGIGGWGSRRKPMAFVRALLRTGVTDLTVVSYGGPDVGLLLDTGHMTFAGGDPIAVAKRLRAFVEGLGRIRRAFDQSVKTEFRVYESERVAGALRTLHGKHRAYLSLKRGLSFLTNYGDYVGKHYQRQAEH